MSVAYEVSGEGPRAIVLSNSLGGAMRSWDPQLEALEQIRTVVRYDHRGHGRSAPGEPVSGIADHAADVLGLLDALGLETVDFAGMSMGGAVGMWLAANAPQRIGRLTLVCTAARFGEPQGWHDRAATVRADGTAAIAARIMDRWFTEAARREQPGVVARYREDFAAVDDGAYAASCEALAGWDFRGELGGIAAQTLVVGGRDDPAAPPAAVELLRDSIPGARLQILEGAAHMANVERPALFTPLLLDHLEETT